jgi:hypothetical protein
VEAGTVEHGRRRLVVRREHASTRARRRTAPSFGCADSSSDRVSEIFANIEVCKLSHDVHVVMFQRLGRFCRSACHRKVFWFASSSNSVLLIRISPLCTEK